MKNLYFFQYPARSSRKIRVFTQSSSNNRNTDRKCLSNDPISNQNYFLLALGIIDYWSDLLNFTVFLGNCHPSLNS